MLGSAPRPLSRHRHLLLLLTLAAVMPAQARPAEAAAAATPLAIEYRDKPPYTYSQGGQPAGFLMERTARLLRHAGLTARYAEVPIRRTLMHLQANQTALCSPGLYKIPEREAYARYSLPIHRDRPHVVLAHPAVADQVRAAQRLAQLFADPDLQPGLLDGVSYGAALDQALANTARPAVRAQLTPLQLARMVSVGRVDYMVIDEEDLAWLRKDASFAPLPLVRISFPDMPPGQLRYLACSRKVPQQTMDRLNQAIRELVPEAQGE